MKPSTIFRAEVLKQRAERGQYGEILQCYHFRYRFVILLFVLLAATFGLVSTISFPLSVRLSGHAYPSQNIVVVTAQNRGIMGDTYVKEGNVVKKGDILFRVDQNEYGGEGEDIAQQKIASLVILARNYEAMLADSTARIEALKNEYREKISKLSQIQGELTSSLSRSKACIASKKNKLLQYRELLNDKTITQSVFEQAQDELDAAEDRQKAIAISLTDNANAISSAQSYLRDQLASVEKERLANAHNVDNIRNQIADIRLKQSYTVRAPIDGRVSAFLPMSGQVVESAQVMLKIVPIDSRYKVVCHVPASAFAIGKIAEGQRAQVIFPGFPYIKYGTISARISFISKTPMESSHADQTDDKDYRFLVELELERPYIKIKDQSIFLQPGMLAEASVVIDEGSTSEYALSFLFNREKI